MGVNSSLPSSIPLDGLLLAYLYTYVLAKLLQNGAIFKQKLTPGFKNHMRNLDNFRQAISQKDEIQWATFVQKIDSCS